MADVHRRPAEFCSGQGIFYQDMPPEVSKYMSFMALDAPRHTKLKRLVSTAFTPRAVAALTERVTERARMIVDELINHGPGDFHELVSKRLPLWAISEMVGVPEDERKALGELTDDMEHINDPSFAVKYPGVDPYEFNVQGLARMAELGRRLAAERRQRPQNDLMTALVQASVDGEKLSDEEIGDFFDLLISAGYATTVHNISIGLHALSQFPGERKLLCSDMDSYLRPAVEEMLRWTTVGVNFRRTATAKATSIAGQKIDPGDKVVLFLLSANRDETVFDDPWCFKITRDPNPHVAFGGGSHFCLGSPLARLELETIFRELLSRLPDIEVVDAQYMVGSHLNAVNRLEVAF
ncbi:cytochrome P450 [Mycobacterium branderi]|uniref:cytochrome P450 n=1 Tax=Mycobacterium branderi TaxID=43348 RepID=UPI0013D0648A|nr:cytochrome P450 [Mycobacterium branderi]